MVPELTVSNFAESLEFYSEYLGFKLAFSRTDEHFAYLDFEGAQLMIEEFREDGWNVGELQRPYGRGINFQIECSNVDELRNRVSRLGCAPYRETEDIWRETGDIVTGSREFLIQDPDGYLLRFSQHLGENDQIHSSGFVEGG